MQWWVSARPNPLSSSPRWPEALSCNENDGESMDRDSQYSSSQKTKRMRTSFKHHQLRTMKSYFAINHNPDAKDLKQLAQKTGLTKRVLQVTQQPLASQQRPTFLPLTVVCKDQQSETPTPPQC